MQVSNPDGDQDTWTGAALTVIRKHLEALRGETLLFSVKLHVDPLRGYCSITSCPCLGEGGLGLII